MASQDLYAVVGVARTASQDDIRSAYRQLARKLHPDVNPGDAAAEARFKEVSAAYSVLSDEKKRRLYDEFGDAALQANFDEQRLEQIRRYGGLGGGTPFDFDQWSQTHFAGGGLDELLANLMGGRFARGGPRRGPTRGADVEAELTIDLALAVRGGTTSLRLGLPGREHVEVRIPEGIKSGQALRLAGLGQPGQLGGPAGDLLVRVRVLDHPSYRRDGDDLHVELPVTLSEAIVGGKVRFQGPTGEVALTLPPGTQTGQSFRLRGLGVKRRDGTRGNLYVRAAITLPELAHLDEAQRQRLEEAARAAEDLYRSDVRLKVQF